MLEFVIGTAGTGKTNYLIKQLSIVMNSGKKAILIVPEQFSFESERRLFRELGPKSSLQLEVLTFTRLCNSIFREFGGLAGVPINDASRYILMSIAVSELQDRLKTYKKSAANISFLENLIKACGEFKTAGITPSDLEAYLEKALDNRLKVKLEDISLIYTTYQSLIENGYLDSEDDLIRAVKILENNNYFKDYILFVDGFTTFMAGEFELLNHSIAQAQKITFAFTTDELMDSENAMGLFTPVKQAISRLKEFAEENGVPVLETIKLEKPLRYKNLELEKLSKDFAAIHSEPYTKETESIYLTPAKDSYDEILKIGATIATLVRTESIKYNEIAVIGRNPESYSDNIKMIFSRYNIPYFMDEKVDIENTALIFGILAALNSIQGNFDSESMLFLAKSPIMGLNIEAVSLLENYCYSWQVRGMLWQSDFANNPRGMVNSFTSSDALLLSQINEVRLKLITPLNHLKEIIEKGGGRNFSKSIYGFLEEIHCASNLKHYSNGMDNFLAEQFMTLNATLWDNLIDILDVFGEVLGSINLSKDRIIELFRLAISSTDIGVIPQTLDQVLVGGADRIRPGRLKVVFAIGLNEGVFPSSISNTGVFSQSERKILVDSGLEIGGSSSYHTLIERFYGYFALTLPSEKLYVSYYEANLKGQKLLPSILVSYLERLFPKCLELVIKTEKFAETESSGLALLADSFREDSVLRATLFEYFEEKSPELLARMNNSAWKPIHYLSKGKYTKELFGENMRLSPSRVEQFYRCPFSYFARDGLNIEKRKKVEFSPIESGSVIHHVLQVMMQKYGGKGLANRTLKQLEDEVSLIVLEYIKNRVNDEKQLSTRIKFLFKRLCSTIARLLEHLGKEFLQSLYTPVAFELAIGEKEAIKPLELVTADGINISVGGVVDRVDVMEKNGKKYIRVVDYKSGNKAFKLQDVLYGLNLQMLLYLFTIQEHGTDKLEGAIPAGVLYMPVRGSYSSVERSTNKVEAEKLLSKQWRMSGILLDDEETLKGMEDGLAGVYIPAKMKKNGELDSRSSLASNEELGRISREIKSQIKGMAVALSQGDIAAYPIDDIDYPTCSYCDYREICGYEEGDPVRIIDKMSRKEVLQLLKEKEEKDV